MRYIRLSVTHVVLQSSPPSINAVELVVVLQVLCALCEPPTKLKYSGNTTNLFSHLRNKHPVTHNKLQRSSSLASSLSKPGNSSQTGLVYFFEKLKKLPTDSKTAQNITKAVGYFMAKI